MSFDNSQPIYKQIIDNFIKELIRGELKQGDKILSQREYAEKARVNPNTVQRAYREMEAMQMVETLRGQGTFIKITEDKLSKIREDMAKNVLDYFLSELNSLGYNKDQIVQMIENKQS